MQPSQATDLSRKAVQSITISLSLASKYLGFIFKKLKKYKSLFALGFFISLATYLFYPAITQERLTLALPGDGWGSIGGIFDKVDNFRNLQSPLNMFSDLYLSKGNGAGINWMGFPANWFWNTTDFFFSLFMSPDNVYDFTIALSWVMIGFAGFMLGNSFNLPFGFALCTGLTLMLCENFFLRTVGHRSIAAYFMTIFVVSASINLIKNDSVKNSVTLGVMAWLNFQVNEYYGYFGVFVILAMNTAAYFTGYRKLKNLRRSLKHAAYGASAFIVLMVCSYPNLIIMRIYQLATGDHVASSEFSHGPGSFSEFSMSNPWLFFSPRLSFLSSMSPKIFMEGTKPGEATFSLGLLIPCFVIFSTLVHLMRKIFGAKLAGDKFISKIFILFLGLAISFSLGTNATFSWSLIPITMKYAPMFRVGVRSFIYMNVILIGLFWACLYTFWAMPFGFIKNNSLRISSVALLRLALLTIGVLAIWEVRGGPISGLMERPRMSSLPPMAPYEALAKRPPGVLIEIPFNYYGYNQPEEEYDYFLHRSVHKKQILNGLPFSSTFWPAQRRLTFYRNFNEIDHSKIDLLRNFGIRYIAINKQKSKTVKYDDLATLSKIAEDTDTIIFEISSPKEFEVDRLRDYIWPIQELISLNSLITNDGLPIKLTETTEHEFIIKKTNVKDIDLFVTPKLALEPGKYSVRIDLGLQNKLDNINIIVSSPQLGELKRDNLSLMNKDNKPHSSANFSFDLKEIAETQVHFATESMLELHINNITVTREVPMNFQSNFFSDRLAQKKSTSL